jgi:hypothetical protein
MYKIIYEGKTIDVVNNPNFLRFLASGHIAITDKSSAQGIVGSDLTTIYSFKPVGNKNIPVVTIENITTTEFNRLHSLLNSDQGLTVAKCELLKAKEIKIAALSSICSAKITAGFNVNLADSKSYNFKLTAEDQLNLLNIENQLNTGAETFVYHATGLPCQIFTRDDMKKILNAYRKHILYHTTYFNAAKQYINSLEDLEQVNAFTYGTDIAGSVTDLVIRQILTEGDINQ